MCLTGRQSVSPPESRGSGRPVHRVQAPGRGHHGGLGHHPQGSAGEQAAQEQVTVHGYHGRDDTGLIRFKASIVVCINNLLRRISTAFVMSAI